MKKPLTKKTILIITAVLFFLVPQFRITAQETETAQDGGTAAAAGLPRAYRAFTLGMTLDELKNALQEDPAFVFRGERDVSFLPRSDQNLVESAGFDYIKRAFFQLKDELVFIMAFTMNTDKIDHYSIFTALSNKYGTPKTLDPLRAIWENDQTRVIVERPLTVKYIDLSVFNDLLEKSNAQESNTEQVRKQFIDDF